MMMMMHAHDAICLLLLYAVRPCTDVFTTVD